MRITRLVVPSIQFITMDKGIVELSILVFTKIFDPSAVCCCVQDKDQVNLLILWSEYEIAQNAKFLVALDYHFSILDLFCYIRSKLKPQRLDRVWICLFGFALGKPSVWEDVKFFTFHMWLIYREQNYIKFLPKYQLRLMACKLYSLVNCI